MSRGFQNFFSWAVAPTVLKSNLTWLFPFDILIISYFRGKVKRVFSISVQNSQMSDWKSGFVSEPFRGCSYLSRPPLDFSYSISQPKEKVNTLFEKKIDKILTIWPPGRKTVGVPTGFSIRKILFIGVVFGLVGSAPILAGIAVFCFVGAESIVITRGVFSQTHLKNSFQISIIIIPHGKGVVNTHFKNFGAAARAAL